MTQRRSMSVSRSPEQQPPALNEKPFLSRQATVGRNSQFRNLTPEDRETLGGIEYRSLKLLLKIVVCEWRGTSIPHIPHRIMADSCGGTQPTSSVFTSSAPSASSPGS